MSLSGTETSLLLALEALLSEPNVTRAGQKIGRGQPAMSHALTRLRDHFHDPLLVRQGRALVLTPKAQSLREPVRRAIEALAAVFDGDPLPDPRSGRLFIISCSDVFAWRFVPELLSAMERDVPDVAVEVRALASRSTDQILSDGVDLAFGVFEDVPPHINQQELFREPYVCVLRVDHPRVKEELPLRLYLELPHVEVVPAIGARPGDRVGRVLAAIGEQRRVTARISHFATAKRVLETSDRILTMTRGSAEMLSAGGELRIMDAPFDIPELRFSQIWLNKNNLDPAHIWLRETATRICKPLSGL